MDESIQRANGSGAHIRHAAPAHSRNSNGGVQEFQHRTITHHRDVHDPHAPLHRPQRLRRAETPPGTGTHLLPARDAGRRQSRRRHLLLHLRLVLSRQRANHQIQPQTRVDHGTRTPVLEPHPRGVLPRVRPDRPRHETHGEEHRAIEHGTVVVRHRIRHLPGAAPLPLQGTEGARTRISLGACCNSTDNLGTVEFHSWSAVAIRQRFRLHLRVHPHLRVQVVYEAVHHQTDMAADRHRIRILPSLHRRIRNAVSDGT